MIKGAGIYLHVLPKHSAKKGDKLMTLYAPDDDRLKVVLDYLSETTFIMGDNQILGST